MMRSCIFAFIASLHSIGHAEVLSFPENFQWCVATAGHQVEGDNVHSDWWAWEQLPGKIKNNEKSGKASFHSERMTEDIKLMKDMGVKTYRLSIEWSRIEPQKGQYDQKAIDYYLNELHLLKKNNILPFVTIHHFVQPQWFTQSGGWQRKDSPEVFLNYVKKIDHEFGKHIHLWVTFNEPTVVLMGGFGLGLMPPGETQWNYWNPMIHILQAHAKAYHYLHQQAKMRKQDIKVGLAFHIRPVIAKQSFLTKLVNYADYLTNWNMPVALSTGMVKGLSRHSWMGLTWLWPTTIQLDELKSTQDFLGINYYTREHISLSLRSPYLLRDPMPGVTQASELNWGIDPEGFYKVLSKAHEEFPHLPFYITENGLADAKDQWRSQFIISHLEQLHKAINQLAHPVLGYCHWSLMDNFEWIEGFTPRFGLIEVDYKNGGQRRLRPSALLTKEIFTSNKISTQK